jgi:hypothetical protein
MTKTPNIKYQRRSLQTYIEAALISIPISYTSQQAFNFGTKGLTTTLLSRVVMWLM